jgi:hypothetical protein
MRHAIPSGRGDATNRPGRSPQRERCLRQRRGFCPSLVIESPHQAALSILHAFWRGADSIQPDCMSPVRQQSSTGLARTRTVLESYSSRLLPCVQWEVIQKGNTPSFCTRASVKRLSGTCRTRLTFFAAFRRVSASASNVRHAEAAAGSREAFETGEKDNEFA